MKLIDEMSQMKEIREEQTVPTWEQIRGCGAQFDRMVEQRYNAWTGTTPEFLEELNKETGAGWSKTTFYRHIHPALARAQKEYDEAKSSRSGTKSDASSQEKEEDNNTATESKACEMPSAEHDVAAGIMNLNSVLDEGEFTVQALKELIVGTGKWKIQREIKRLISTLSALQKELENS